MEEEKRMTQHQMPQEEEMSSKEENQCNHWHSEATNSCSGRCMLKANHSSNHGCGICHGQW